MLIFFLTFKYNIYISYAEKMNSSVGKVLSKAYVILKGSIFHLSTFQVENQYTIHVK